MAAVTREDLIQFARRDWAAVARAKDLHWLRRRAALPESDLWRRSDDLLRHARTASRVGPSRSEPFADWHVHHRVGLALRAVSRATR